MGQFTNQFNDELSQNHNDYKRSMYQTYFTAPEWRNVEMSEELGKFLSEGNPFYRFPFFKQISTFWSVFRESYLASKQHHTQKELLTSEYMMMNAFIGITTTVGFGALGIVSFLLSPFMKAKNDTSFQQHVSGLVTDYAQFIHTIPFYNYPYFSKFKPLLNAYKNSPDKTFADFVTLLTASTEILARTVLSAPVAWWYNQPQNQAADKTHLLVKSKISPEDIKKLDDGISIINESRQKEKNETTYHYAHLTVPRYEAFAAVAHKLVENDVHIRKIAGQDRIQFKVEVTDENIAKLPSVPLYTYKNHLDTKKFAMIDVASKNFNNTVESLKQNDIKIKFMHDF